MMLLKDGGMPSLGRANARYDRRTSAGVTLENAWERELLEHMRPSNDLWRSMGRRTLSR